MKEKIKNVVVSFNNKYVIWAEDIDNIVRDTTLNVEAGCIALYIVNGVLKSINTPGRWVIKTKEEEKSNSRLQLICVNTDKTFDILCGAGNIPYKDLELNLETVVGAHGECKIRISQPWSLYTSMGHANITAEEIDEYVKLKLREILTTRLAEVLQHFDYDNIMTQQSTIAEDLEKKFSQKLNEIGIEVTSFALAGIKFSDEYLEKRKTFFEGQNLKKAEKEERRAREREQRAEIDSIVSIANATRSLNVGENHTITQNNTNNSQINDANQPVKYCSRCGTKISASATFCPSCGKKQ